jgi:hypothetical protein
MRRLIATFHVETPRNPLSQQAGFWPRVVFQLSRPSERIVEKRPEIGLDDVEFTPRYRDFPGKIIDNDRVGPGDRITTIPRQLGIPTTLSVAAVGRTRSAPNPSLPGWAGLTRSGARIDPGDPGCRQRTGLPPHCSVQLA